MKGGKNRQTKKIATGRDYPDFLDIQQHLMREEYSVTIVLIDTRYDLDQQLDLIYTKLQDVKVEATTRSYTWDKLYDVEEETINKEKLFERIKTYARIFYNTYTLFNSRNKIIELEFHNYSIARVNNLSVTEFADHIVVERDNKYKIYIDKFCE